MKQTILALSIVAMLVLSAAVLFSIFGKEQRREETGAGLSEAVETTIDSLLKEKSYSVEETDEFLGDFMQAFFVRTNSQSGYQVRVLSVDKEKGALVLNVECRFLYANGKEGKNSTTKFVFLENK